MLTAKVLVCHNSLSSNTKDVCQVSCRVADEYSGAQPEHSKLQKKRRPFADFSLLLMAPFQSSLGAQSESLPTRLVVDDAEPLESIENGRLQGFSGELLSKLLAKSGVALQAQSLPRRDKAMQAACAGVHRLGFELTVQHVLGNRQVMFAIGRVHKLTLPGRTQAIGAHQTTSFINAYFHTFGTQLFTQRATAIAAATRSKRRLELHSNGTNECWRLSTLVGLVETGSADAQQPTDIRHRISLLQQWAYCVVWGCQAAKCSNSPVIDGVRHRLAICQSNIIKGTAMRLIRRSDKGVQRTFDPNTATQMVRNGLNRGRYTIEGLANLQTGSHAISDREIIEGVSRGDFLLLDNTSRSSGGGFYTQPELEAAPM
nr:hypothetical protein [Pseudomonas sp. Hg5Tf]MDH2561128.1 hypothetical protein [Pseudomonas sp. Hg5Tf]